MPGARIASTNARFEATRVTDARPPAPPAADDHDAIRTPSRAGPVGEAAAGGLLGTHGQQDELAPASAGAEGGTA